jgi:hypothetical protein
VIGLAPCFGKNGEDIFERLAELRNEFIALKMLIGVPADLAGNEHGTTRSHADAVGIADWR